MRFTCALALVLAATACTDDDAAPDAGVDLGEDGGGDAAAETGVRAIFVVPREGDDGASWDLPFPSDLQRDAETGGIDLSRFPNPVRSDVIALYVALLKREVDGFSTAGTAYLRFTAPLDPASFPDPASSLEPDAAVFLVALESGTRVPIETRFQLDETDYWDEDTLAVRAVNGFVLAPSTTYAVVVTSAIRAADGQPVGTSDDLRAVLGLGGGDPGTDDARARVYGPAAERLLALGTPPEEIVSLAVFTTMDPVGEMFRAAAALKRDVPEPEVTESFVDQQFETFTLLSGHYGPAPLYQTGEAPFDAPGSGRIEFDDDGDPVVQQEARLRFALAVPTGEMPAGGYPIVITSHGTGGDYKSFVESGTAALLAEYGVASIGFDQVLHGERAPPGTQPETSFFNFLNPVAGRDNARQSALDNVQQARLVRTMVIPSRQLPNPDDAFFDPARVGFFGHSQGGLNGSLLVAIDDTVRAAVLSGTGAVIGWAILQKTDPTPILPLLEVLLDLDATRESLDIFHPLFTLTQTFIDPADPVNYAPYWSHAPRVGDGVSVLLTEGLADGFAPPPGTEAIAVAAHLPILGPVGQDVLGLDLLGLAPVTLPCTGNVTSGTGVPVTTGLWQVPGHGHFSVYDEPGLTAAAPAFLASATSAPPGTIALP